MNEATLKAHASKIAANIDIAMYINEAMESYFSGFEPNDSDESAILKLVATAVARVVHELR